MKLTYDLSLNINGKCCSMTCSVTEAPKKFFLSYIHWLAQSFACSWIASLSHCSPKTGLLHILN